MSTNCLDGFPQYSQYSTLLNTALPTSSSTAHLPALMLAAILDNAAPTIITNHAGDVLYANHTTLALLEHDSTSSTTASQRFSLPPTGLNKSLSSLPYHHSQLLEPVDALNAESIRNHLTGFTTLGLFFQKQSTVSRNVECVTAQTRRSIHLRLSTRILPTTAFDPSQSSPRKLANQVPSPPSPTSTSYSATAADARSSGPAPKHTHSTPPNKHQNSINPPAPFLLLTTLTDLTDPSLIFARDDRRVALAYNSEGLIVEASPMCLSSLGYTLDELLGTWGYDHVHPDDVEQMRDSHARLLAKLAQDERQVFRMRRKNGKYAWFDLRSAGTQTEGAYIFVGFDVTKEKELEMEAQRKMMAKIRKEEGETVVKIPDEHNKANKFVGFICHELRNPLNGIIGFNSLLLDTPQLSETQLEYAEAIAKISQHMCNLLNQTLDLCQTQQSYNPIDSISGSSSSPCNGPRPDSPHHPTTPRLNYRFLNLKEVVEFGFVTVSVAARAKDTKLQFRDEITPMLVELAHPEAGVVPSTSRSIDIAALKIVTTGLRPYPVYGDEDSVRKIILNYLTNAIKYTPAGGAVTVHLSVESPTLPPALAGTHRGFTARCAISDTGLGIPTKDICRLFLPYSKLIYACGNEEMTPQAAAAAGGSSGLGLSICKELADKIGGCVGVDSTIGHGSTFWVTFPVYYDLPEGYVVDEDETKKMCRCVSACIGGCKLWSSPAVKPMRQRSKPAKVLMVEDNSVNQRVAQKYLEKMGEEVTVASDGADALERMRKEKFDILFVDLQMPVMDGYTFTRHVRAAEHERTLAKVQAVLETHRRPSTPVLFGLPGASHLDSAHSSLSASSSASSSDSLFSPTHEQAAFIARRYSDFSLSPASTPVSEPTTPSIVTSHNHIGLILGERPVPIVACTGNVLERDRALCKELGMDGFLSKPYKMDDMRRCIDELVVDEDEDMERGE